MSLSPHGVRRRATSSLGRMGLGLVSGVVTIFTVVLATTAPAGAATLLNGNGSSFAAPAVTQWNSDVSHSPYSLSVNYTSSSSGTGRYLFTNETVDFAVSDTGYVNSSVGTTPPSFPYEFIPVTAAGVAFMYNVPGLTKTLQLTSYTACLLLTGQITNWDDAAFHLNGANSGVTLPNLAVKPVTESDPAGTNYVLEEYCIAEQPSVWAQYAKNMSGTPAPSGVAILATTPGSNWEAPGNGYDEQTTSAVASTVANTAGAIGPVQENYATDSGFTGSNPAKSVADVQNTSRRLHIAEPGGRGIGPGLRHPAGQRHPRAQLQRAGPARLQPVDLQLPPDPHHGVDQDQGRGDERVRQLRPDPGPAGGAQAELRQPGPVPRALRDRPRHRQRPRLSVSHRGREPGYSCGDLTPAEVQAGQTTPTCGVTNGAAPPAPPGAPPTTLNNGHQVRQQGRGGEQAPPRARRGRAVTAGRPTLAAGSNGAGADPSVALTRGSPAMALPAATRFPPSCIGAVLVVMGWFAPAPAPRHSPRPEGRVNRRASRVTGPAATGGLVVTGAACPGRRSGRAPGRSTDRRDRPRRRGRFVPVAGHEPASQYRPRVDPAEPGVFRLRPRRRHR